MDDDKLPLDERAHNVASEERGRRLAAQVEQAKAEVERATSRLEQAEAELASHDFVAKYGLGDAAAAEALRMRPVLSQWAKVLAEFTRLQQSDLEPSASSSNERERRVTFEILKWVTDLAAAAALGDHSGAWVRERVWKTLQESQAIGDQKDQGPTRRSVAEMIVSAAIAYQRKLREDLAPEAKISWLQQIRNLLAERLLPLGGPDELCEDPEPLDDWLESWSPEPARKPGKRGVVRIMAEIAARYRAFNLAQATASEFEDIAEKHRKNIANSLKNSGFNEVAYAAYAATLLKQ